MLTEFYPPWTSVHWSWASCLSAQKAPPTYRPLTIIAQTFQFTSALSDVRMPYSGCVGCKILRERNILPTPSNKTTHLHPSQKYIIVEIQQLQTIPNLLKIL